MNNLQAEAKKEMVDRCKKDIKERIKGSLEIIMLNADEIQKLEESNQQLKNSIAKAENLDSDSEIIEFVRKFYHGRIPREEELYTKDRECGKFYPDPFQGGGDD